MKGSLIIISIALSTLFCQNKVDSLSSFLLPPKILSSSQEFSSKLEINYDLKLLSNKYFKEIINEDALLRLNYPDEPFGMLSEKEFTAYLKSKIELKNLLASFTGRKRYPTLEKIQDVLGISQYLTVILFAIIHLLKYH